MWHSVYMDNTTVTLLVVIAAQLLTAATCYYAGFIHASGKGNS